MNNYPVSNEILQAALVHLSPSEKWEVTDVRVYVGNWIIWDCKDGLMENSELGDIVEHLLKPRNDWPRLGMSKIHTDTAKEHASLELWILPHIADTGEEYVLSCKFYDKALELHAASQDGVKICELDDEEHKLPVAAAVLQDALNFGVGERYGSNPMWKAWPRRIESRGITMWTAVDGLLPRNSGMSGSYDLLKALLEVPEHTDLDGIENPKRGEIITAAREHAGFEDGDIVCPMAWTGETYYKWAMWRHEFARLVAEHRNENRKLTKTWNFMSSEQLQKEVVPYTEEMHKRYTEDVEYAHDPAIPRPGETSHDYVDYDEELAQLNALITDGTFERRDGESHVDFGVRIHEALAAVYANGSASCRLANVDGRATRRVGEGSKTAPNPLGEGIKAPAVQPIHIANIPWPKEQPWEKQARIAASAGYAHVPPEETDTVRLMRGQHETVLRLIKRNGDFQYTYAHARPAETLTGCRIENGWAVRGYAVTDTDVGMTNGDHRLPANAWRQLK